MKRTKEHWEELIELTIKEYEDGVHTSRIDECLFCGYVGAEDISVTDRCKQCLYGFLDLSDHRHRHNNYNWIALLCTDHGPNIFYQPERAKWLRDYVLPAMKKFPAKDIPQD